MASSANPDGTNERVGGPASSTPAEPESRPIVSEATTASTSINPKSQDLYIVVLFSIHEKLPVTVALDVHSSLFAANQHTLRGTREWEDSMVEGGDIVEQGVRPDGRDFWSGTPLGVPLRPESLPRIPTGRAMQLINCEISKAAVQWGATNGGAKVFIVVSTAIADAFPRQAESQVVGIFSNLNAANEKLREVVIGYQHRLSRTIDAFRWPREAFVQLSALAKGVSNPDGTLSWTGLKGYALNNSPLSDRITKIVVHKITIDQIHVSDADREERNQDEAIEQALPQFGEKLYTVSETASVEGKVEPTGMTGGKPDLKIYGIYHSLKEANEKVREVVMKYRKWHLEMEKSVKGAPWYKAGAVSWDGIDKNGHFFWVGTRSMTELCRVDVQKTMVDWHEEDHDEDDERHRGGCFEKTCTRCWCLCKKQGCNKSHWYDSGGRVQDDDSSGEDEMEEISTSTDGGPKPEECLAFERTTEEALGDLARA